MTDGQTDMFRQTESQKDRRDRDNKVGNGRQEDRKMERQPLQRQMERPHDGRTDGHVQTDRSPE